MKLRLESEARLLEAAGVAARAWRDSGVRPLLVGLSGELGAGKTTWVRGMLRGLGYAGRVPSPTYTLLEYYEVGALTVVHLDLYRLGEARELEFLGLRDWLAQESIWLLAEWPERGGAFAESLDLRLRLEIEGEARGGGAPAPDPAGAHDEGRQLELRGASARGRAALEAWPGL